MFILLCSILLGQSAGIQGVIIDEHTGESLKNVNIYFDKSGIGTTSDRNGFFSIIGIRPGNYTLLASHIGFETWKKEVQITENNPVTLEIKLIPTTIKLDSINVSISRNINKLTQGQHHLSSQFIRRIPSAGEPDLLRAIQSLPGITSTNDFNLGFYVRGGNRDQNLLLLDDMPVFNPFHMSGIFSTFDPDAVQSVDFQKGGISPEYGNHLSSVVNINLRDGKANKKSFYTNISLMSSRFRWEGPFKNGSFMFSVRRTYLDLIVDALHFIKILPDWIVLPYNFIDGIGKVVFRPSPTSKLRISSYLGKDTYDLSKLEGENIENKFTWVNGALSIAYDKQVSPSFMLHSSISSSVFSSKWLPTDTTNTILIDNKISLYQFKSYGKWNYSQKGNIQIGVEPKQYNVNFDISGLSYTPLHMGESYFSELSAFAHWTFPLFNNGKIELGDRLTYFSYHDEIKQSLFARASIQLPNNFKLSGGWNTRHQGIMTVGNEEVILTMFEAWLPTPKDLGVMSSEQVSFGLWHISDTGNRIGIEVFQKEFSNLVEFNTKKYTMDEPDFVNGNGLSKGIEFLYRDDFGDVQTLLSYTLSETVKKLQGITYNPRYDHTHDLNFNLNHPLGRKWTMGWKFVYQTGSPFTPIMGYYTQHLPDVGNYEVPLYGKRNSVRLPNYHRLDVNFSRKIKFKGKPFTLYIDLINIYGRLNVLTYSKSEEANMQMPPLITFGIKTRI